MNSDPQSFEMLMKGLCLWEDSNFASKLGMAARWLKRLEVAETKKKP